MVNYEEYIQKLRNFHPPFDDLKVTTRLEEKITGRWRKTELLFAGSLAILLAVFLIYSSNFPSLTGNGDTLVSSLFQQKEATNDPVIDYVFTD